MSAAPKSVAPLMTTAFMRAAEGELRFISSRRNSRTRAVAPPAIAVACDEPEREM